MAEKNEYHKPPSFQADPDDYVARYTLELFDVNNASLNVAQLISVNPNAQVSSPLSPGEETWNVPSGFLSNLSQATKLVITGTAYKTQPGFSSSVTTALFQMAGGVSWPAQQGSFPSAAFFGRTGHGGLGVLFSLTWTGSAWAGTITWYQSPSNNQAPGSGSYAFSVADSPIELTKTPPSSQTGWYAVTLEPSQI
jgi:hypothetical protein